MGEREIITSFLEDVFTYGDATSTHFDIVNFLRQISIDENIYKFWGRNASQLEDSADVVLNGTFKCPECGFKEKHLASCKYRR